MERCKQCKKILFKKKDGTLMCPNGCDDNQNRLAFNTVIDARYDRRGEDETLGPWDEVRD